MSQIIWCRDRETIEQAIARTKREKEMCSLTSRPITKDAADYKELRECRDMARHGV